MFQLTCVQSESIALRNRKAEKRHRRGARSQDKPCSLPVRATASARHMAGRAGPGLGVPAGWAVKMACRAPFAGREDEGTVRTVSRTLHLGWGRVLFESTWGQSRQHGHPVCLRGTVPECRGRARMVMPQETGHAGFLPVRPLLCIEHGGLRPLAAR